MVQQGDGKDVKKKQEGPDYRALLGRWESREQTV